MSYTFVFQIFLITTFVQCFIFFSFYYFVMKRKESSLIYKTIYYDQITMNNSYSIENRHLDLMMIDKFSNNFVRPIHIEPMNSTGSENLNYSMKIDMLHVLKQISTNKSVPYEPINNPQFSILISESDRCEKIRNQTGHYPDLLIFIKSAVQNLILRETIRLTWGNPHCWAGRRVVSLFILGAVSLDNGSLAQAVLNESLVYRDIIQQDFIDAYYNNTYKLIFGLKWAITYCSSVPIIVFADDDYFLYPKNVISYIEGLNQELREVLISGYVWHQSKPIRDNTSKYKKWIVQKFEYADDTYPPYVAAGNFFISMEMARKVYIASLYTKYLRFDDVYLGIILKKILHTPIHLKQVYSFNPVAENTDEIYSMISSHEYGNPIALLSLWTRLNCQLFCNKNLF